MSAIGIVSAGLQLGLTSLVKKRVRGFYDNVTQKLLLKAQITIEEVHTDELEITDHPVDSGSSITDHAFKHPAEVTLKLAWSNSADSSGSLVNPALALAAATNPLIRAGADLVNKGLAIQSALSGVNVDQVNAVYQSLLQLQETRIPFSLYTGKRVYKDMLIRSLSAVTDSKSEEALFITMTCRQVILVSTRIVQLPSEVQQDPSATAAPVNRGVKNLINIR